jgi:tetratricopeptide (TPR) repeat protein
MESQKRSSRLRKVAFAACWFACAGIVLLSATFMTNTMRGLACSRGDVQSCTALLGSGMQTEASEAITLIQRGLAYSTKDTEKAETDFTAAITIDSHSFEAYNFRGLAHEKKGEYSLAVADFREALRLRPDFAEAWNNLGCVYGLARRYGAAIEYLNRAIRFRPDFSRAYYNRGYFRRKQGDSVGAEADEKMSRSLGFAELPSKSGVQSALPPDSTDRYR